MTFLKDLPKLDAACFLEITGSIPYSKKAPLFDKKSEIKPFLMDGASLLMDEEKFADVASFWNEQGLNFLVRFNIPFENVSFPKVDQGESVELFIDTRLIKDARSIHKHCHHFVFLPKSYAEVFGIEITKIRGSDKRDLADPSFLIPEVVFDKKSFLMKIHLSKDVLYGYDTSEKKEIGFSYRINRSKGESQCYNLSSKVYALERFPSLWSKLALFEA